MAEDINQLKCHVVQHFDDIKINGMVPGNQVKNIVGKPKILYYYCEG